LSDYNEKEMKMMYPPYLDNREYLDALIDSRIRYVVNYAYNNIPFYKELFDKNKINPETIRTKEDLEKLPIITSKELIKNSPPLSKEFSFESEKGKGGFRFYTSGTKGQPKIFYHSRDDMKFMNEISSRAFHMAGINKKDVVLNCFPIGINVSGMATCFIFNEMGIKQIPAGVAPFPPKEQLIKTHKPTVLLSSGSYVDRLARQLMNNGTDPKEVGFEKVIIGGEASSLEKKKRIAKEFSAKVFDLYGSTEGMIMAMGCTKGNLHLMEDANHFMLYDNEKKEFIKEPGKKGQAIMTTLIPIGYEKGSVLINYKIGDSFEFEDKECSCGLKLRTITPPHRSDDAIVISGAKLDMNDIERLIYNEKMINKLTGEYEILVDFDEKTRTPILNIKLESLGKIDKFIGEDIKSNLINSNFPLANEISNGRIIMNVDSVEPGNLDVLKIKGKPKRIRYIKPI